MAFFNEAWFIHQLNDTLVQLAQQKIQKTGENITLSRFARFEIAK